MVVRKSIRYSVGKEFMGSPNWSTEPTKGDNASKIPAGPFQEVSVSGSLAVLSCCHAVAAYETCIPAEGLTNTARGPLNFMKANRTANEVSG